MKELPDRQFGMVILRLVPLRVPPFSDIPFYTHPLIVSGRHDIPDMDLPFV